MKFGAKLQKIFYINKLNFKIMKNEFKRKMWETFLKKDFICGEIEINEYHKGTKPCEWYGTFIYYSHIIEDVESYYFFKIMNGKISYTKIK